MDLPINLGNKPPERKPIITLNKLILTLAINPLLEKIDRLLTITVTVKITVSLRSPLKFSRSLKCYRPSRV
jgi:hypothetical protein